MLTSVVSTRNFMARLLTSFAAFHSLNTGINLVYTLVQLLVLAHVLMPARYAEIIVMISVGFYLQPFDQSLGRANYVVVRRERVGNVAAESRHEISAILLAQAVALISACVVIPLTFRHSNFQPYAEDVLFLVTVLFMNAWAFTLQPTAWAVDLERTFSYLSLLRRSIHFLALALLWFTGSLLVFGIFASAACIGFHVAAQITIARQWPLLPVLPSWRKLRGSFLIDHLKQIFTSLLSTLSELVVLNSPYLFLTLAYGAGPTIVVFDSIMKLARFAMAGTRTLAEIQLSSITRLLIEKNGAAASKKIKVVTAFCVAASALPAALVIFDGSSLFGLLFGQNNFVPPEAYLPAALIILVSGLYQPITLFLSFANFQRGIRIFTLFCCAALGGLLVAVAVFGSSTAGIITAYGTFFLACSTFGGWLVLRLLGGLAGPIR